MLTELKDILHLLGNPDTAVVTEGLTHEGELALLVSVNGDTGGMDLGKARICKESALAVCLHCGRSIGVHCIGGKEIGISVTAGSKHNGMSAKTLNLTGNKVTGNDTLGFTIYNHKIKHLMTGIALYGTCCNLLIEGCIGTKEELLTGLSPGIESTAYLDTAERTVCKITAVFTCKRNALGNALIDD